MSMSLLGSVLVVALIAYTVWRAWMLLRFYRPAVRTAGTVLSAFMPVAGYLIVVVYHYAKRAQPRSSL
jgi:hypothetical protein